MTQVWTLLGLHRKSLLVTSPSCRMCSCWGKLTLTTQLISGKQPTWSVLLKGGAFTRTAMSLISQNSLVEVNNWQNNTQEEEFGLRTKNWDLTWSSRLSRTIWSMTGRIRFRLSSSRRSERTPSRSCRGISYRVQSRTLARGWQQGLLGSLLGK